MGSDIYAVPSYLCVVVVEINNEVFTMALVAFLLGAVILERRKPFSDISWSVLPLAVVCVAADLAVFPVMP